MPVTLFKSNAEFADLSNNDYYYTIYTVCTAKVCHPLRRAFEIHPSVEAILRWLWLRPLSKAVEAAAAALPLTHPSIYVTFWFTARVTANISMLDIFASTICAFLNWDWPLSPKVADFLCSKCSP